MGRSGVGAGAAGSVGAVAAVSVEPVQGMESSASAASSSPAGGPGYGFKRALTAEGLSVIAEVKRRSPSAGDLNAGADAAELARRYRDGGAACLSVLTDGPRFGGSPEDLRRARAAAGIPVLRKDFLTSLDDIRESSAMGADAALLIVDDVDPAMLRPLHELALELGLDVLTEIRAEPELELAVGAGAYMVAVNQRSQPKDTRFTVDFSKAVEMAPLLAQAGPGIVTVAASGIGVPGGTGMAEIAEAGYDAALIGEALVTAPDPAAKLRGLLSDAARGRPARH